MNKRWHTEHPMPPKAAPAARFKWHMAHAKHCACREVPKRMWEEVERRRKKKKLRREDHKSLAIWAADCAEHVLRCFEEKFPEDDRPRKAVEACRTWVRTGVFKMADVRKASLSAHAAAREAEENSAARFAARAAGQAAATPHVPTHAFGAPWYAVKASDAAGIAGEGVWQLRHLPKRLYFIL